MKMPWFSEVMNTYWHTDILTSPPRSWLKVTILTKKNKTKAFKGCYILKSWPKTQWGQRIITVPNLWLCEVRGHTLDLSYFMRVNISAKVSGSHSGLSLWGKRFLVKLAFNSSFHFCHPAQLHCTVSVGKIRGNCSLHSESRATVFARHQLDAFSKRCEEQC